MWLKEQWPLLMGVSMCFIPDVGAVTGPRLLAAENKTAVLSTAL